MRTLPCRHHANTSNQAEHAILSKSYASSSRGKLLRVVHQPAVPIDLEGNWKAVSECKAAKALSLCRSLSQELDKPAGLWVLKDHSQVQHFLNNACCLCTNGQTNNVVFALCLNNLRRSPSALKHFSAILHCLSTETGNGPCETQISHFNPFHQSLHVALYYPLCPAGWEHAEDLTFKDSGE